MTEQYKRWLVLKEIVAEMRTMESFVRDLSTFHGPPTCVTAS